MDISNLFHLRNITLIDIFTQSLKKWYIYVLTVIICLIGSIFYTNVIATPLYESSATIYIQKKDSTTISSSDFSISTYLTYDFMEIITDDTILGDVSNALNNKYSSSQIRKSLNILNPENTRIIKITVTTPNAKDSKTIADTICNVSQEKIVDIMELDRVQIIGYGELAKKPSSPNLIKNILFATIIGIFLSVALITLSLLFNNKFTSSTDVEKYLELPVLCSIPYNRFRK